MSRRPISGRSSGRVVAATGNDLDKGSFSHSSRDDSLGVAVANGGRVSAARSAAVQRSLTDLDRQIVRSLATVRLASGRQLQRLYFGDGEAAARRAGRCLKRLTDLRVLGRLERRTGGVRAGSTGFVYVLDVIGQAMDGLPGRRPWQLGNAFVTHGLLVTECYVLTTEAAAAGAFSVGGFMTEPDCWLSFTGPGGLTVLKPDALAVIESGEFIDRWWLEVDNATESPSRIAAKAALYAQAYRLAATGRQPFPKVLWVCTDAERERRLIRTLRALPEPDRDLMAVCRIDGLTAVVAAGPDACSLDGRLP